MSNFNTGDVLTIEYPLFKHYGIYVGNNLVIHNSKKVGRVEEVTLEEFADNRRVLPSKIRPDSPSSAVQRARALHRSSPRSFFGSGKFLNGLRGLVLIPSPRPSPGGGEGVACSAPYPLPEAMFPFIP